MGNEHFYALIMAGGGGTRLWPLSRQAHPKQALTLFGERSMFQLAVDRLLPLLPVDRILVVTAADQVAPLSEQVPELPLENFIVEPLGRGTAPCIGLSALHLHDRDPDAIMAVVTADHYIRRVDVFRAVLQAARAVAEQGFLVTLGIAPTKPATGYGYICRGEPLGAELGFEVYQVQQFTEKPDLETAQRFLDAGVYAWNSGMFIWRAERILEEIARWMPELDHTLQILRPRLGTTAYQSALDAQWPGLSKQTIDYGIMERADRVAVLPADLGWSDVGAWSAVMELNSLGEAQASNVVVGDPLLVDCERSMVLADGGRLVAMIGIEDLIVVDTPDALLITRRDQSQRVRDVVDALKARNRTDLL
ncbi:MAG: mannose-1-phosphate guanylyltransferase [Anaerolineae bacterium]|nr:mannose-1-phosphate guanylyltransferase [Anaerolineae bacterium]